MAVAPMVSFFDPFAEKAGKMAKTTNPVTSNPMGTHL
jgi:hypothetical protein